MKAGDYRFTLDGFEIRVVIAGDVVALPEEGWSYPGFGAFISEEWLLTQPKPRIPGSKARRLALAACIVAALEEHHGGAA